MSAAPHAPCPDPGVLERFARGDLQTDARADTEAHLDACAECMRVVCELAAGWSAMAAATPASPSEEARERFARALEIRRGAYGEQHSAVGMSHDDMGVVLDELERDDEAVRSFEQALAIREKTLTKDHPDIAATMVRLAKVHEQHDRRAEAAALFERALAIRTSALGADDPLTKSAREALERVR